MISPWLFTGRRSGGRRAGESVGVYVDRPGGWVLASFFLLLGLSILDAWFTLDLLKRGEATEANPMMRAALRLGDHAFVLIKTVVTALAVGFLCLHKNWFLGRACVISALLGYAALTFFHLWAQGLTQ